MRTTVTNLAITMLAALSGCTQGTPGGPGATAENGEKPAYGQAEDTFNLSVPIMSSALQQGAQFEATVGIERGKNFGEDVGLLFADVPKGVTIKPAAPMIMHGDSDAKFTFTATNEAQVGEYQVKVTGHPTNGSDAKVEFKLTVAAKDSFTLSVPLLSTSLKQGETVTASVGINRDKTFDQDVILKVGRLPAGVTVEPSAPVIKRGNSETPLTFTAAADASLGDFSVTVTGHPESGLDATSSFKLTVIK